MIESIINEEHIGLKVIYTPFEFCPDFLKEEGVVTEIRDRGIMVRYDGDVTAKLTPRDKLRLLSEDKISYY